MSIVDSNPRLTYEQKIEVHRGMAIATIETVATVLRERQRTTLNTEYRDSITQAQVALSRLCADIRSGKISADRVQALTWVQAPKVDVDGND